MWPSTSRCRRGALPPTSSRAWRTSTRCSRCSGPTDGGPRFSQSEQAAGAGGRATRRGARAARRGGVSARGGACLLRQRLGEGAVRTRPAAGRLGARRGLGARGRGARGRSGDPLRPLRAGGGRGGGEAARGVARGRGRGEEGTLRVLAGRSGLGG